MKTTTSLSALVSLMMSTVVAAESGQVLSPEARIDGKSQAEWSRLWWQWAASFQYDESPVADQTGQNCQLKQNGRVFFLAGTYGSNRTIRKCVVPRGKYIFFPLINYIVTPCSSDGSCLSAPTCKEVEDTARATTDDPAMLILEIDGKRISNLQLHRQASPECFDIGALANTSLQVYPSASNGYYAMLTPLAPGTHVINFGGVLASMTQAVTYTLFVE